MYIKKTKSEFSTRYAQGKIYEHKLIAEKVLGKPLAKNIHIHHIDYNSSNNKNNNLIICSPQYHALLHARTDAYNICGNASYMKCPYCKQYDDPKNLYVRPNSYQAWHRACSNAYKAKKNPKTGPYKYNIRTTIWSNKQIITQEINLDSPS